MALTDNERQASYRERLVAADKTILRVTVTKDVAARLRRMARDDVSRAGSVIAKALDALEMMEGGASCVSPA